MPDIFDWQHGTNRRAAIEHAAQLLARGGLVGFPTDTTYAVAGSVLVPDAVERLSKRASPLTLALPSAEHALDWAPALSVLGRRLARRCWPGPVTLVVSDGVAAGLAGRLPEAVRRQLSPDGTLSLYVPAHDAIAQTLLLLPAPLILGTFAGNEAAAAQSAQAMAEAAGTDVALILDDGPSPSALGCSRVRVNGQAWTMLEEGVVRAADVARSTTCLILFVCTGNTCRSPMAAALCRKMLAERLGCPAAELPDRGYIVLSAGLAAMPGDTAAPAAVEVVQELGGDLSDHVSRPLNSEVLLQADYLLTMTRGHQMALASRYGEDGPRPRLLDPEGGDIADPVGADREVYRECALQIVRHLERFLAELPLKTASVEA